MRGTSHLLILPLLLCISSPAYPQAKAPPQTPPKDSKIPPKDAKPPSANTPVAELPKELGGKELDAWVKDLNSKDPSVRQAAVRTIVHFGPPCRKVVPYYYKVYYRKTGLPEPDAGVRSDVATLVGYIGEWILTQPLDNKGREDIAQIIFILGSLSQDSISPVRLQAANSLGKVVAGYKMTSAKDTLGPEVDVAIKGLVGYCIADRGSWEVRKAAAFALGQLGRNPEKGPDPKALKALCTAVQNDTCSQVKLQAILSLSVIGKPANQADLAVETKVLEGRLKDPDKNIQIWSLLLLMYLDKTNLSSQNLTFLARYLNEPDLAVRLNALRAFATLRKEAKPKVPDLIRCLQSKEPDMVYGTILALADIGSAAEAAVPELKKLTGNNNANIKEAAIEAIKRITAPTVKEEKKK